MKIPTTYIWLRYPVWHPISLSPLAFPLGNLITRPEGRGSWELVISSPWARLFADPHTEASAGDGFMPVGISYLQFSYLFIISDYLLLHPWYKQAKKNHIFFPSVVISHWRMILILQAVCSENRLMGNFRSYWFHFHAFCKWQMIC